MAKSFLQGVTIYQKGGTGQSAHPELKLAAEFYLTNLLSTRMVNTLRIRIELRAGVPSGRSGDHENGSNGSIRDKCHTIRIRRAMSLVNTLSTLAHECVHVAQQASGRLQKRVWKSDGHWHIRWEGKEQGIFNSKDRQVPWEVEARTRGADLLYAWQNRSGQQVEQFKLSNERMQEIIDDCDDTAGMLIKESTLRYFIEKAVNDDRKGR